MVGNKSDGEESGTEPLYVHLDGTINDEFVTVEGVGCVPNPGVYEATFNFDLIPESFHPTLGSILVLKCVAAAATRNGAKNIIETGADGYDTRRVLTLGGENDGYLEAEGDVCLERGLRFEGNISGDLRPPDDLAGTSMFIQRLGPGNDGRRISGPAVGSTFRIGGGEVPFELEEETELEGELTDPMTERETRIVTESGTLHGRTYRTVVHSILDGGEPLTGAAGEL
jgi:hypothetical protein